jgi:predicted amidophosphoribosyltransferase
LLLRIRDTPPQSSLPRQERLRSVQGAFAPEPRHQPSLRGQRVVLVDDVMTSGASLNAASSALRTAGVRHVTVLVFARTE